MTVNYLFGSKKFSELRLVKTNKTQNKKVSIFVSGKMQRPWVDWCQIGLDSFGSLSSFSPNFWSVR